MTWHEVSLKQICDVDWGNTKLTKSSYVPAGKYLAVSASGADGLIDYFEHEANVPVLSAIGAQCGRMFYPGERFTAIKNTITLTPKETMADGKFLYYLFTHVELPQRGAGQPFISKGDIEAFRVLIPDSVVEQLEIVTKLDGAFADINLLEENLASGEAKVNQLLKSILDSEYSLQGLKIEPLEKLVDILDNQRIPINATERLHRVGNVPYYGATGQVGTIDKAIFNETLILLGEDGVPFFDSTKHKAYEISGPSWVNNHAHVLRAKPELVIQRYLLHFLNIFNYTGYVNGATRLKLTQGDMKRIPVPVPDIDVQEKIVSKIDLAFQEINNLNIQIALKKEIAKELRQSILSNAFTQDKVVA
jgi:type I restriction enzyme S subunit